MKKYLIPLAFIVLAGTGYFGLRTYLDIQHHKEVALEQVAERQKQAMDEANKKIADLETKIDDNANRAASTTADLTTKLKAAQQQKPTVIIKNTGSGTDLSSIINEWQSRVALIQCAFLDSDGGSYVALGSSLLLGEDAGTYYFQTNKHVVRDDNDQPPVVCSVKVPGDKEIAIDSVSPSKNGADLAIARVTDPSPLIAKNSQWIISSRGCKSDASIGDPVVILGYPGIGSHEGITATEGIISGTEGWFYITSAKIDHGNSGGVAINVKEDCYLGLPTYVESGSLESLGRILDWRALGAK